MTRAYRILCGGAVRYVRSRTMLGAAEIALFRSCAVEARKEPGCLDADGILVNAVAKFNARTMLGLEISGAPWTAEIEI